MTTRGSRARPVATTHTRDPPTFKLVCYICAPLVGWRVQEHRHTDRRRAHSCL